MTPRVLTDGPFVEAKEYLGGFWIIEAENDDAAIEWTKQASRALQSRVEVRALQERPDGVTGSRGHGPPRQW